MIEIKTITVRLGEKEYEIREASFAIARPWKKRLMEEVKPLFETLAGAPNLTFEKPEDLFKLFPLAESIFIGGIEAIVNLLIEYSPALTADSDYILNNATDRQIVAAFREVVLLADPFGVISQINRQIGLGMTGISSSLQSANGDAA